MRRPSTLPEVRTDSGETSAVTYVVMERAGNWSTMFPFEESGIRCSWRLAVSSAVVRYIVAEEGSPPKALRSRSFFVADSQLLLTSTNRFDDGEYTASVL
jgi:hypothetical protein